MIWKLRASLAVLGPSYQRLVTPLSDVILPMGCFSTLQASRFELEPGDSLAPENSDCPINIRSQSLMAQLYESLGHLIRQRTLL